MQFEQRKDGFVINGQLVVDPEGKVERAAVDPLTGDFAYLVQRMDGRQVLKRGRGTATPPLVVTPKPKLGSAAVTPAPDMAPLPCGPGCDGTFSLVQVA